MMVTVRLSGVLLGFYGFILATRWDGEEGEDWKWVCINVWRKRDITKQHSSLEQTNNWIPRKTCCVLGTSAPVQEAHLSSASCREEIALCRNDINHFGKREKERGIDGNDLVLLAQKHAAWAKSAWICLCKCLIVMRTILLQILSCRIYLVWKSGRCSHLLLALIAQEGNAKWPLIVFSSFCVMFYSLIRCLLLENDLVAQNSTWRK